MGLLTFKSYRKFVGVINGKKLFQFVTIPGVEEDCSWEDKDRNSRQIYVILAKAKTETMPVHIEQLSNLYVHNFIIITQFIKLVSPIDY